MLIASFSHRLYLERIGQVEHRLTEVQKDVAAEYLIPLAELDKSIKMRAHVAGVLRELRLNNINNKHESESKGAHENHEVSGVFGVYFPMQDSYCLILMSLVKLCVDQLVQRVMDFFFFYFL